MIIIFRVQTGAFRLKLNAYRLSGKLKKAGFSNFIIKEGNYWKVQVGAFNDKGNALGLRDKLKRYGFSAFVTGESNSSPKPFRWPGWVPWKTPKRWGTYIQKYPTHFDWRDDVEEVCKEIVQKFNVSVVTYWKHPPNSGRKLEFVSLDVWGPKGRGYALDPNEGQRVWNYLWNRQGIKWFYGIYRGRRWNRFSGWSRSPRGPLGSDAGHWKHIHLTYLLNQ